MQSICVFCGAQRGVTPVYAEAARAVGRVLAARRIRLVFGGGHVGLMGAVADATLAAGGEAVGVIPHSLLERELAHGALTELEVVGDMHERKARMAALSDGFVVLPGGIGTLEETFEIWTWAQLGFHTKPLGFLEVNGYFESLLRFLDHAVDQGFVRARHLAMVAVEEDADRLIDRMRAYAPPKPRFQDGSST